MSRANPIRCDLDTVRLTAYDADGFPGMGIGGNGDKTDLQPAEIHHPFGLMGRPQDPTLDADGEPKLGATCLRLEEDNADACIALGDPRCTAKLPQLTKGSACFYGDTLGLDLPRVTIDGSTGSITVHVPLLPPDAVFRVEHAGGTVFELGETMLHLGASPAADFVCKGGLQDVNNALMAAKINELCAAASITPLGSLSSVAATKVKVT